MAQLDVVAANSGGNSYALDTLGPVDWLVYPGSTTQVKKSGGTALVYSRTGSNPVGFTGTPTTLTWTGGAPTATGSSNGGQYGGTAIDTGYQLVAPADTATRTLRIWGGAYQTTLRVVATLSDGSAPIVTDTSTVYVSGNALQRIFTITYSAASEGQTLTVQLFNHVGGGNINIQGAALSADVSLTVPDAPTSVSAVAGNGQATVSFTAPSDNGGAAITAYTVTSSPGGVTATGASSPVTVTGLTNETAYTFTVTATNSQGTGPASATSNSVTPSAAAGPVAVANNDANLVWSPYNWDDRGSYKETATTGAYVKFGFSGTSVKVKVDLSALGAASVASGNYPVVRTIIDGYSHVDTQLTSATTAVTRSGLAAGSHTVDVYLLASQNSVDRWNTPLGLRVTGFELDAGAATQAIATRSKRMIYFGDSITEGYYVIQSGYPAGNSALHTVVPSIALALDAEYGQIGYGAQGYAQAGQGNVPNFNSAYGLFSSGRPRLVDGKFSPEPDYICVEHGANGTTTQASVQTAITNLRTAAPNAKIFIMVPAGGFGRAGITAAVNANASDADLFLIDLGAAYEKGINGTGGANMYAVDALHRNTLANARVAAGYAKKIQAAMGGGGEAVAEPNAIYVASGRLKRSASGAAIPSGRRLRIS